MKMTEEFSLLWPCDESASYPFINTLGMSSPLQKCTEILRLPILVAYKTNRVVDERASYVYADVSELSNTRIFKCK